MKDKHDGCGVWQFPWQENCRCEPIINACCQVIYKENNSLVVDTQKLCVKSVLQEKQVHSATGPSVYKTVRQQDIEGGRAKLGSRPREAVLIC